jgi:general secretion pathway protein A
LPSAARSDHLSACEAYYGLTAHPFSLTPDPRFVYPSRSHSHAFGEVTEALRRREGVIVVTGDIGTGKTVLCRALLDTFEPRIFLSVILDPLLGVDDLLQQVLADFGLIAKPEPSARRPDIDRHQLVATLQRFLASLSPVNAHAVIMIDEAQHLAPEVLEEIRLLSNFEANDSKLLQIVLVGQPDLDEVLRRTDMQQLSQRVVRRVALHPLSPEEVQEYVERRLAVAAGDDPSRRDPAIEGPRFDPAALQALASVSRGIPRVVNTVANQALEIGFERQTRDIDSGMMAEAAKRLQMIAPAASGLPSRAVLGAVAALIVAVVAIGWWWSSSSSSSSAPASPAQRSQASQPGPPAAARAAAPAPAATASTPRPANAPPTAPATANEAARSPSSPTANAPGAERPAAAPAKPPAADKAGAFEITVAAFRTTQRAEEVADAIGQSGLPVTTRADPTGTWHLIVVGPLRSSEEAEFAQKTLARQGFSGTKISPVARSAPQ